MAAAFGLLVCLPGAPAVWAGDILRGGQPAGSSGSRGSVGGAGSVAASSAALNGKDALARTSKTLQAMQALQTSARLQAQQTSSNGLTYQGRPLPAVPNGLGRGGLQVAPGVPLDLAHPAVGDLPGLWQGASLPTQKVSGGKTTVTITQTDPRAILTWETFNLGSRTKLTIDQSAGGARASQWIVFNKVDDPSGVPSQILGAISAPGQVYVINRNGLIFGGGSVINTHAFVGSALPIDDGLISRGLLNNPDAHFLFSALAQPLGNKGTPATQPLVSETPFEVSDAAPTHTLGQKLIAGASPVVTVGGRTVARATLSEGADYTLSTASDGKTIVTFTAAGLAKAAGTSVNISYQSAGQRYGDVIVQRGAVLNSPTSEAHVGGKIALFGANVVNAGTISTPDGQTILAAGLQVGLAAHAQTDPSLRGLDVYVGQVADPLSELPAYAGTVTNTGQILSARADITLAGKNVNQFGVIADSTSVSLNGRIDLLASYNAVSNTAFDQVLAPTVPPFFFSRAGAVTLGAHSVTQIVPELDSSETAIGTRLALPSLVNIQAHTIHLGLDSTLLAPNASLPFAEGESQTFAVDGSGSRLAAGISLTAGDWKPGSVQTQFVRTGGQIFLESGATIDASGSTGVPVSVTENIVSVQLRGSELAGSPLQRAGLLRGETIQIDLRQSGIYNGFGWVGTPLADASGYVGLIQRGVGELTTSGGTVQLGAGGSVVMQPGSKIDVSGGSIAYQGGMVQTTRLLADGHVLDISKATPDRLYDGIYTGDFTVTHSKYGLTDTFSHALSLTGAHYEPGYLQGGDGGSLAITAPAMALDGTLLGHTDPGPRQRTLTGSYFGGALPAPGSLTLTFLGQSLSPFNTIQYIPSSPSAPKVTFSDEDALPPVAWSVPDEDGEPGALPPERRGTVLLSPKLMEENGFERLAVNNPDGGILVPAGLSLTTAAGGSLTLIGANIDVQGRLAAPGGSLIFRSTTLSATSPYFFDPAPSTAPVADAARGTFTLGAHAVLSTAGLMVDDRLSASRPGTLPLVTDGGTVMIKSYNALLAEGSSIDASGGVQIAGNGRIAYGQGGAIDIEAGQDQQVDATDFTRLSSAGNDGFIASGRLQLGARLLALSGSHGGTLTLLAPSVSIGGPRPVASAGTLWLAPEFFSQAGFSTFNLTSLGDFTIAPRLELAPIAQSAIVLSAADGAGLQLVAQSAPMGVRTPVSLNFKAQGVSDFAGTATVRGDLVLGAGSVIRTDPLGSVSLSGQTATIDGSVFAPGGAITVAGASKGGAFFSDQEHPLPTVIIGSRAILSAAGTAMALPDPRGLFATGIVVPGGSIQVSGNLVAEAGSVMDVSGASGVFDRRPAYSLDLLTADPRGARGVGIGNSFLGYTVVPTSVESSGGSIVLSGGQELFSDALLLGAAGGPSAQGGSISISSGIFLLPGEVQGVLNPTLSVTQSGFVIPTEAEVGVALVDGRGHTLAGLGHVAVSSFQRGGFDAIALNGTVRFEGDVHLSSHRLLTLGANPGQSLTGGVLFADGQVTVAAPVVQLGLAFRAPGQPRPGNGANYSPTYGSGSLSVAAQQIDIGDLSLQGIGSADLLAFHGDIRGNGTLDIQGRIHLAAGQIYPTTESTFTVAAYDFQVGGTDHRGGISIDASGGRSLPLSAGGVLNLFGSVIQQGGVLRAPIGTLNLGWDGTGTAPVDPIVGAGLPLAATKVLTLTPGSLTSVSAIDPLTGRAMIIPYGINRDGTSWIDPSGNDITSGGVAAKGINLSASQVLAQSGSVIDLRGGGDLLAYRFVPGIGGFNDILAETGSFAVIPGYDGGVPFAPNNPSANAFTYLNSATQELSTDAGYVNGRLAIGDRIYLTGSSGLPAGTYTLLPARYALLPHAVLITEKTGALPVTSLLQPEGANLTAGYRTNGYSLGQSGTPLLGLFEVASASVVNGRAEYDTFSANTFLAEGAEKNHVAVPRLPIDAGQLVFRAEEALRLKASVTAQAGAGGLDGLVDISSAADLVIANRGSSAAGLVLDPRELSSFGAASLLVGGTRAAGANGTVISVSTNRLTVDNAGSPLTGPEIILVAKTALTLADGAEIRQVGDLAGSAGTLQLGSDTASGDGALVRVTGDPAAGVVRTHLSSIAGVKLTVGDGALLSGAGVTLDSTAATDLGDRVRIDAASITLNSGQISIQLSDPGALQTTAGITTPGLVLAGATLAGLSSAQHLSLLSYSSIDLYGNGLFDLAGNLALHAGQIRGFNTGDGVFALHAASLSVDDTVGAPALAAVDSPAFLAGRLELKAGHLTIGRGAVEVGGFQTLALQAEESLLLTGSGELSTAGDLAGVTHLVTARSGAIHTLSAAGALALSAPAGHVSSSAAAGLGATLTLAGESVRVETSVLLPSGSLTLHADGSDGAVTVGGRLDVAGTAQTFFDRTKFTGGGVVSFVSDHGDVVLTASGMLDVSAPEGGTSAGTVSVSAAEGDVALAGTLRGRGGPGSSGGKFSLVVGELASTASLNDILTDGHFTGAQSIRVRAGDVVMDGTARAQAFTLSADAGSITVSGTGFIDAHGETGGDIRLLASGSVMLEDQSRLTVAAADFNAAGKGGSVSLEAGSETGGVVVTAPLGEGPGVDIQSGATIDLTVARLTQAADPAAAALAAAARGHFSGTLHLRAPQVASVLDLQIGSLAGQILGASSILVEGYRLYTPAGGLIDQGVKDQVRDDGNAFTAGSAGIAARLLATQSDAAKAALRPVLVIAPGAEILNASGSLTLASDWDLSGSHFANGAPGVLTLRAAGNLVFTGTLSDGFTGSQYTAALSAPNSALPANTQSWSYRLAAGADGTAADFRQVQSLAALDLASPGTDLGSLQLGVYGAGFPPANRQGAAALTSDALAGHYQVIRTGTGDIEIAAARDVQFRNQFATIYTAGAQMNAPVATINGLITTLQLADGLFDVPVASAPGQIAASVLGPIQNLWKAQYSLGGGDITIQAGRDILHQALSDGSSGTVIDSSERQLPNNWLYRRGFVNRAGVFGTTARLNDVASTTWWIDYSNFFEGVGALGGGNVTLVAGRDVKNVDAVVPTNALMRGKDAQGRALAPDPASLLELGGGNLVVQAGRDINGGAYYVEKGNGTLDAGGSVLTNSTRSVFNRDVQAAGPTDLTSWLPTTLFLGKSTFDVTARGDVNLGPVANPFLQPGGVGNVYWYKTYFSTYSPDAGVRVSSLGGDITLKENVVLDSRGGGVVPILQAWETNSQLLTTTAGSRSFAVEQPWLRLNETNVLNFEVGSALMPPSLEVTAFAGDLNLIGNLTLSPAARSDLNLAARGSIVGLNLIGLNGNAVYQNAIINLSDSDPATIPSVASPRAYQLFVVGNNATTINSSINPFTDFLTQFSESGSALGANGALQNQQARHGSSLLHAGDSDPITVYAETGDLTGVTLYAPKVSRIVAGQDVTDVALYLQNAQAEDISVVSAGRDLIAFNPNTPYRSSAAAAAGIFQVPLALAGDLQIGGPGILEVLAGRNLDLGEGRSDSSSPADLNVGLASIGNARNPNLPFNGADLIVYAGAGKAGVGLSTVASGDEFIRQTLQGSNGSRYFADLREDGNVQPGTATAATVDELMKLPAEQRTAIALELLFYSLRDAARDSTGDYYSLPSTGAGEINLSSRSIVTTNGGNISIFAPGGGLSLGTTIGTPPPGIVTQSGGNISIYTAGDVDIGVERIFTLRGGNEIIFSASGDIAAGASSKTVQSAPPTRVLIDPQSADVKTDLAGLATGGGIGVLATVAGIKPGNVDLIAPKGTVDAGDAGIQATGNLSIAAVTVLNADNIAAGGSSTGVPSAAPVSAPSLASVTPPPQPQPAAAENAAQEQARKQQESAEQETPSIFSVEVIGYGGGDGAAPGASDEDEEARKRRAERL